MIHEQNRTIDKYISSFPKNIQEILEKFRHVIKESAPEAQETISYRMPAFKLKGRNLVFFAAFKNHIGYFPTPSAIEAFKGDLSPYETSKGTIRFPLDKPIPYELVKKIAKFRVTEVLSKDK